MDLGLREISLAVIGAGPKAAALAAKAWVLRERRLGSVDVLVFERKELAAHWNGLTGFTDGQGTNVTPPEKDVGFPYKSPFGINVDNDMMMQFSWAAYQISLGSYADWIDRGCPRPRHEVWGRLRRMGTEKERRTGSLQDRLSHRERPRGAETTGHHHEQSRRREQVRSRGSCFYRSGTKSGAGGRFPDAGRERDR